MNSDSSQASFLDPKTIIAIVLVGASWIGWQLYMKQKYPETYEPKTVEEQAATETQAPGVTDTNEDTEKSVNLPSAKKIDELAEATPEKESLIRFNDEYWSFVVSSKGMGVKDVRLKKYSDREGDPIRLGVSDEIPTFATNVIGRRTPVDFHVERVDEAHFVGVAQVGDVEIRKTLIVDSARYSLDTKVSVSGKTENFAGLTTTLAEKVEPAGSGMFLLPQFERQEVFVVYDNQNERTIVAEGEPVNQSFSKVNLAAMGSQYFAMAVLDKSNIMPEAKVILDSTSSNLMGTLSYQALDPQKGFDIQYLAFAGPKSLNLLNSIDETMAEIIDFGMFSFIATYILQIMKAFYQWLGNWGLAIILLTIVVRLLLLPFTVMSFRSMKAMQKIQPLIKELREKHKEDPQRLNQEMMLLMREHKANPMGGCLPMLLQFPVFIALYQVLGQSIELYKAPFMFWIQDLSSADPFYILPVLMGITMFLQQKLTPSTMDPAQARIFMIMPVVFTFFMVTLPSGLTLYIFVSSLFAVVQQLYFVKDKAQPQPV